MSSVAEVDINLHALEQPADPALLAAVQAILAPVQNVEWPSGKWPVQ
jgi:hypothetical protein